MPGRKGGDKLPFFHRSHFQKTFPKFKRRSIGKKERTGAVMVPPTEEKKLTCGTMSERLEKTSSFPPSSSPPQISFPFVEAVEVDLEKMMDAPWRRPKNTLIIRFQDSPAVSYFLISRLNPEIEWFHRWTSSSSLISKHVRAGKDVDGGSAMKAPKKTHSLPSSRFLKDRWMMMAEVWITFQMRLMQRLTFPFPFVHHQSHDWKVVNY